MPPWIILIVQILFGIILAAITIGASIFSYISWKARAKKWSALMILVAITSIFLLYWLILEDFLNIIPF